METKTGFRVTFPWLNVSPYDQTDHTALSLRLVQPTIGLLPCVCTIPQHTVMTSPDACVQALNVAETPKLLKLEALSRQVTSILTRPIQERVKRDGTQILYYLPWSLRITVYANWGGVMALVISAEIFIM